MQNMKPHAALLASPGLGHLIPILELGKRMVTFHGFHVSVLVVASDHASTALLKSPLPENLDTFPLPPVDISGLVDPRSSVVSKLVVLMRESLPLVRSAISAMKSRPAALIVDLFGTEAFTIAEDFNMRKYVFDTTNAWFLAATIYAPTVNEKLKAEHCKNKKPLEIPGCKTLMFEDTLDAFLDLNDPVFDDFLAIGAQIPKADGILVNSWEDLEPTTLAAFRDTSLLGRLARNIPVHTVGPLRRQGAHLDSNKQIMEWLDKQPTESVIYVSFGSGGTLSSKQITELAWGLENSQQRFIWVVRPPIDDDAAGAYFTIGKDSDGTPDYLPEGFLTRTHDIGLVVPQWAPQAQILSHPSVGGFLSHCGWNSTLESITNAVPMIAWPLYAEQKMNAAMLTEELKVAVRPKASPLGEVVGREEIEMMTRKIMAEQEGITIRKNVKELKKSGEKALSSGGSSCDSLAKVAKECLNHLRSKLEGA